MSDIIVSVQNLEKTYKTESESLTILKNPSLEIERGKKITTVGVLFGLPLVIPAPQIVLIALAAAVISLLASVIPALKAGREKPIETLRKI